MSDSVRNACDGVIQLLRHNNPSPTTIAMAIVLLERYRDEQPRDTQRRMKGSGFDKEFQPR